MSTEGVRCASYLPTDGYLDPSLLTTALADGAREGGCRIFTHTRVTGIDVERVRGVQTEWGPIEAEVVVNAGGMFAAEIGRMAGVRVPIVPFAHEYLVTQPFRERGSGRSSHLPTLRDPDLLIYFREEGGGLVMGGYERHSAPWALDEHLLDAIPADFNGRLLEEDWPRFEEIAAELLPARAGDGRDHGDAPDQRPRGLHAGQRVLPRRERGARLLRRGRLLRPRARRRGRHRARDGRVDPRRRAVDGRLGDGHPALRPPLPLAQLHAQAHQGGLRDLLRHPLPRPRAPGGPAAAHLERLPWHAEHGAAFGEKSGWERVNWYESNAAAGDESLRPRGWAGMHWSPAIGAEHRATRERGRAVRRVLVRQARDRRAGRAEFLERCATTASRARSARSPTPRCSTGAAASSATSPSRAWRRSCSRSSPARRSATTT